MEQKPILTIDRVQKHFGGLVVLRDVSFDAYSGQTLCLIGPNGAGKTTLFNIIAGAMQPSGGRIWFEGRDITRLKPNVCCKLGIARSFQIPQPFSTLTVLENIEVALEFGHHKRPADTSRAYAWLERVGLARWVNVPAAQLPLGARKKLEMVRALATEPKVILLDEVMAGLSAEETEEVAEIVRGLKKENIAVIFVEHVLHAVMTVAERIIVLHEGRLIADGPPSVVSRDPAVIEAYLGGALNGAAHT